MTRARFGLFEFDPASGVLTREGSPIRLQPQPARVLALLVGRAGELVTRDDLRAAVWGDATFVDFERGLNFCIAHVRNALGDSAESPRFIETIPRRGYRFIAPVSPMADAVTPELVARRLLESAESTERGEGRPLRGWRLHLALVAALLMGTLSAVFVYRQVNAARPQVRIAVLPFDNETNSSAFDVIAGGVADATVARLATPDRLKRITVVGNAAALRRPRAFRDLKAIGESVGADYVVLAQVKSDGGRVRLIAHLIRVSDEVHVWANTFDRPAFPLDVQSELAESIAAAVDQRLTGSSPDPANR
jgi:DNA-binding winged helix-turn-helix (wHTH) protein/TolB-like protein